MYKKNKEMPKLILLIILIVAFPIIFISIETIQKIKAVQISTDDLVTNTLDNMYEKIISVPKNNDSSTVRKCLTEIFELMNEKEFGKLYSMLTDDMKENIFKTEEEFEANMQTYLGGESYSPSFSKYQKLNNEKDDVFIVKVGFAPYSTSEETILDDVKPSKTDTFTIYLSDDKNYKFSFFAYIGSKKARKSYENDAISCKIENTHLYTSKTVFELELTNKLDSDIFIEKNGVFVYTGLMPKYYEKSIAIPANSSIKIQYTVYTGLNLKESLPTKIYLQGIHADGNVYFLSLPISYPVKI